MTDDIDDEFRDIVSSQLADLDAGDFDGSAVDEPAVQSPPPPLRIAYELTTPRSWTPAPEDDDFVPPPPLPPAKTPSTVAWVGILAMVAGAVILAGVMLGQISNSWGTGVGFLSVCGGIVLLFTRLPKDRGPDNGARV